MRLPSLLVFVLALSPALPAAADVELARQIFRELIESNTAPSGGNDMSQAIAGLERHLRAAGFGDDEIDVVAPAGAAANLVVRLRSPAPQGAARVSHDVPERAAAPVVPAARAKARNRFAGAAGR